jgi:NTP pyrophosphatase (non-canonical NTP hydrolase)
VTNISTTTEVLEEVRIERLRQDLKWGEQNHHPHQWLAILGEEVGEASKGTLEGHFGGEPSGWANYREELIQVAAVAMAAVESFDRNGPPQVDKAQGS